MLAAIAVMLTSHHSLGTDYVRLRAGYVPPHWHRGGERWDEGYQNTVRNIPCQLHTLTVSVQGYFLDYIERKHGEGSVRAINESLRDAPYESAVFKRVTGRSVDRLWKKYKKWLADGEREGEKDGESEHEQQA